MVNWYSDSALRIDFSIYPDCNIRYPKPTDTKETKKDIEKYPFINNKIFKTTIFDFSKNKIYSFEIEKNYKWDGATIPRIFWRIIGAKTDPRFLIPSLIHDKLCENHLLIGNDRYLSTKVFERLLFVSGLGSFKRWLMFHTVDNAQKFNNWKELQKSD